LAGNQANRKKSRQGRLRIVAGIWRSRLLQIADVPGLRPTPERIRETLFNWLAEDVPGARCLDLCAGTGALGLEALSRGAARAVFVEKSAKAVQVLESNIRALAAGGAEIRNADAVDFLAAGSGEPFDIVFIDPPFAAELHGKLCRLLTQGNWFAERAKVYVEMGRAQSDAYLPSDWTILKDKAAGNVRYLLATTTTDGSRNT